MKSILNIRGMNVNRLPFNRNAISTDGIDQPDDVNRLWTGG